MHRALLIVLIIVMADQASKAWVINTMNFGDTFAITPFFNTVLVHNTGIAFGLFANTENWIFYSLLIVAICTSLLIAFFLYTYRHEKYFNFALSLILGGAIGNLIDRFIHGYVIDFIDIYYQHYHWPAFNVADSAICTGALLLIIENFWRDKNYPGQKNRGG